MVQYNDWCNITHTNIGQHAVHVLVSDQAKLNIGIAATAAILPSHYTKQEQISRVLEQLGKTAAAEFIRDKLPTTKTSRSGDVGEILATEYISTQTDYDVPIKRLRWKDHQNMAMRGDDVIGFKQHKTTGRLKFLKTEVKSRAKLSSTTIKEARKALDKDKGLPSAHTLSFISSQLIDVNNLTLSDAITAAQYKYGIKTQDVRHLLFTFSGNAPEKFLTASMQTYAGTIPQLGVGVHVDTHGSFIEAVYNRVIANANN